MMMNDKDGCNYNVDDDHNDDEDDDGDDDYDDDDDEVDGVDLERDVTQ